MPELPYHIVIGLEVHVQLLTRTKLFCGCATTFGQPPNTQTCPVCMGLPGALPVMNRRAFELALRAATALNCQIAPFTKWDRKQYFYPDLPKNFQTSQYDLPFSHDGRLDIETAAGARSIGIIRVHLEEDAGKSLHDESGRGGETRVDLNRTGTPLLEIVSQPDMKEPEEASAYLEEIRLLLRELGVSDCEMQEGSLRCDANVNIHVPQADGTFLATPLVEVKNLNSIRSVERAVKHEAERQYEELTKELGKRWHPQGKPKQFSRVERTVDKVGTLPNGVWREVPKTTAGWDDARGSTAVQRRKEEASDYRYFPEPDLVPVRVSQEQMDAVRAGLGELPAAQRQRLQTQYSLSAYDAGVLSARGRAMVAYFEETAKVSNDAVAAKNWLTNDVLATLNERKLEIDAFPISAAGLGGLIAELAATGLPKQRARDVYAEMLASGSTAKDAIAKLGFKPVGDESELLTIIQQAIAANAKAVADFKKGKTQAVGAIKGFVMKATKGQANMQTVEKLLLEEMQKA